MDMMHKHARHFNSNLQHHLYDPRTLLQSNTKAKLWIFGCSDYIWFISKYYPLVCLEMTRITVNGISIPTAPPIWLYSIPPTQCECQSEIFIFWMDYALPISEGFPLVYVWRWQYLKYGAQRPLVAFFYDFRLPISQKPYKIPKQFQCLINVWKRLWIHQISSPDVSGETFYAHLKMVII
jgi:hypothetical protein